MITRREEGAIGRCGVLGLGPGVSEPLAPGKLEGSNLHLIPNKVRGPHGHAPQREDDRNQERSVTAGRDRHFTFPPPQLDYETSMGLRSQGFCYTSVGGEGWYRIEKHHRRKQKIVAGSS